MAIKVRQSGQWVNVATASLGTGTTKLAQLWDEKTSGTNGGTFTLGDWRDRTLNEELDPQGFVTLESDNVSFSLLSGTYRIAWSAPAYNVDMHKTQLVYSVNSDFSAPVTAIQGSSEFDSENISTNSQTRSFGDTQLTITQKTYFKIQHRSHDTQADWGLGSAADFPDAPEIYTQVSIEDLNTAAGAGGGGGGVTDGDKGDITVTNSGSTWTIDNDVIEEKHINAGGSPANNKILKYDSTHATKWSWADPGATVTTSDSAPASPSDGDLWWNSTTGILNVYYQDTDTSQWVNATGRPGSDSDDSVINVKKYGALGDGSTNDSVAIQAAFDAANSSTNQKGKRIVFPAGVYCVESQLNVTLDAVQEQFHVEGLGNVVIRQKHANNGFNIDIDTKHFVEIHGVPRVSIRGIKFAQDNSLNNGQGIAINLDGNNQTGQHTSLCTIDNCQIGNWGDQEKSFGKGINISKLHDVSITNCSFFMDFGDSADPKVDQTNTAVYIEGSSGAEPGHYYVDNCSFFYGNAGIVLKEYCEGLYVSNSGFVANDNGIICDVDASGGVENGLQVTNCHFNQNTQQYGHSIYCESMVDITISNCLLYSGPSGSQTGTGSRGNIYLDNCENYIISNTVFKRHGTYVANQFNYAITITNPYNTHKGVSSIYGNNFSNYNTDKRAIWLQTDSNRVKVLNNSFYNCNNNILDEGSENTTFPQLTKGDSSGDPAVTTWHVQKTTNQTIDNETWTDISGLSQTVTALSPTSKFLITATVNGSMSNNSGHDGLLRLMRGSTVIGSTSTDGSATANNTGFAQVSGQDSYYTIDNGSITYLDTPGKGDHTYHIEGLNCDNSSDLIINGRAAGGFFMVSHMTIQQIA